MQAGANVNAQGGRYDNALQGAIAQGNMEEVKLLIHAGADVNAQGKNYENALHVAVDCRQVDMVRLLLQARAEVNSEGERHSPALKKALIRQRSCTGDALARLNIIVQLLLDHGAVNPEKIETEETEIKPSAIVVQPVRTATGSHSCPNMEEQGQQMSAD